MVSKWRPENPLRWIVRRNSLGSPVVENTLSQSQVIFTLVTSVCNHSAGHVMVLKCIEYFGVAFS